MLYNSRITPINTVATSFVTKLCGKPTWDGLSSNQVFAGWIFDVPYWETVKMIEIKEKKAQELLGINGKWASFDDFWDSYNNYKLDAPLKKAYKDGDTKLQKQLRDADEKFNIIRMLYGTQLMPVLQSPLLSVHVMVIMFSYALFGLTHSSVCKVSLPTTASRRRRSNSLPPSHSFCSTLPWRSLPSASSSVPSGQT